MIDRIKQTVDRVEEMTRETKEAFEMFRPFTVENAYVFRSDNVRALFERISEDEQQLLTWNPEKFDWYDYWMNIHLPGLKKWVFPTLEEDMRAQPKRVYTYRDLLELFETSTKRHATRVAMRIERDGRKEQYTYADLRELATRAAGFLRQRRNQARRSRDAVQPQRARVGHDLLWRAESRRDLHSRRSGKLDRRNRQLCRARATPPASSSAQKLDRRAFRSARQADCRGLKDVRVWTFDEVFELPDEQDRRRAHRACCRNACHAQSVASLIFTSGTTGQPKGVMLSHRNLTSMVSMLSSVFDMDTSDGVLSVLPLHHTFEFSTGFLTPLSRGAQITYLPELTSEQLAQSDQERPRHRHGRRARALGTAAPPHQEPAPRTQRLDWQDRRPADASQRLAARQDAAQSWASFFYPIHEGLGGRIRYFISGGSALNEKIQRDFQGLGFTILEGYGLTEASPV